jgi:hypothetical protein
MPVLHFVKNNAFFENKFMSFVVSFHEKVFIKRGVDAKFGFFTKVLELHNKFIQRVLFSGFPFDMAFAVDFVFALV